MVQRTFLMCPPLYFDVEYEINPWMNLQIVPEGATAYQQWERVVRTLRSLGCKILLIDPVRGQPDMVFTANSGLVFDHQVILGHFRHKERQGEEALYEAWFRSNGYRIHRLPEGLCFEGEGDCTIYKEMLLMAHGFRTDPEAHIHVGKILQKNILSLELTDPRFYHLDTCLVYLSAPDVLVYYPGAFSKDSVRKIRKLPSHRVEIPEEEACHFVCNSVSTDTTLLLHLCTDRLRKQLEEFKIQPLTAGTSEFLKAGGSVRCMVLQLH